MSKSHNFILLFRASNVPFSFQTNILINSNTFFSPDGNDDAPVSYILQRLGIILLKTADIYDWHYKNRNLFSLTEAPITTFTASYFTHKLCTAVNPLLLECVPNCGHRNHRILCSQKTIIFTEYPITKVITGWPYFLYFYFLFIWLNP